MEKHFLHSLPCESIRKTYRISSQILKVNKSSMISCKSNLYSVPPEYVGKYITAQIYDEYLHLYDNTNLIAIHEISSKKINYLIRHYEQIAEKSHVFSNLDIQKRAQENLKILGELYDNN